MKPLAEFAAWWGACIATIVLLWDVYKWQAAGARIRLTVSGNMEAYGHLAALMQPGQTLVVIEAVNVGSKNTTLTHVFASYYATWWRRLFRKESKVFVITPGPQLGGGLPSELAPGARWLGAAYQNIAVEQMSREGYLYIGLHHSMADTPIRTRLKI